ncbi:PTS system mannose/fructose/sorbose family transporter subunit IID [Enterococcus faecalis]|nr:PTS system mannose/fructose/sorbose family transporter subunit IID [Enterococcus faecalis]
MIETLSDKIGKISSAANIGGVAVIAALNTSFVKANIAIKYSHNVESGEKQVIAIQDILDKITPKMLPVILTILVFYLIKKKNGTRINCYFFYS